jgi:hypothetical protein
VAIFAVFGALILTAAYAANQRLTSFRFVQTSGDGNLSGGGVAGENAVRPVGFAALDPRDPTVRFSDTRVGHVLFASSRSDDCRRLLFDNRTGAFYEAKEIFCGERNDQAVEAVGADRVAVLRQFFRR